MWTAYVMTTNICASNVHISSLALFIRIYCDIIRSYNINIFRRFSTQLVFTVASQLAKIFVFTNNFTIALSHCPPTQIGLRIICGRHGRATCITECRWSLFCNFVILTFPHLTHHGMYNRQHHSIRHRTLQRQSKFTITFCERCQLVGLLTQSDKSVEKREDCQGWLKQFVRKVRRFEKVCLKWLN